MGWFSTSFTLDTPLPREEAIRRLTGAVRAWPSLVNPFGKTYVGEVATGGFDFAPPGSKFRIVGSVENLPTGGSRVRVKVRLSHARQAVVASLPFLIVALLWQYPPDSLQDWAFLALGLGLGTFALALGYAPFWIGTDRARAFFERLLGGRASIQRR